MTVHYVSKGLLVGKVQRGSLLLILMYQCIARGGRKLISIYLLENCTEQVGKKNMVRNAPMKAGESKGISFLNPNKCSVNTYGNTISFKGC